MKNQMKRTKGASIEICIVSQQPLKALRLNYHFVNSSSFGAQMKRIDVIYTFYPIGFSGLNARLHALPEIFPRPVPDRSQCSKVPNQTC